VYQSIVKSLYVPFKILPQNGDISSPFAYTKSNRIPVLKNVKIKTHSVMSIISFDSVFLPILMTIIMAKVLKT